MNSRHLIIIILGICTLLANFPKIVNAQLYCRLRLEKESVVPYESLKAKISISNRAGRDIILGDSGGRPWLDFQVNKASRGAVSSSANKIIYESKLIPAGKTVAFELNFANHFPLSQSGAYSIRASVFSALHERIFTSNVQKLTVFQGNVLWERSVGVPLSEKDGGQLRRYKALLLSSGKDSRIYCRVEDEKSGYVLVVRQLGKIIISQKRQFAIDGFSRFHALFMNAPRFYRHVVLAPSGQVESVLTYKDTEESNPTLYINSEGAASVRGGRIYDPSEERAKLAERKGYPLSAIPPLLKDNL